jgi:hypothetical protein
MQPSPNGRVKGIFRRIQAIARPMTAHPATGHVPVLPEPRRTVPADPDRAADTDSLLASAERSALVTITQYTAQGSAETAGASTDLILARHDGRLHVLTRDPADRARLIPGPAGEEDIRDMLAGLLT